MTSAAILWTGGKDCVLALHQALKENIPVHYLITFAPSKNADFLAHPLPILKLQSEALGIPHKIVEINEPFKEGYEDAIQNLKNDLGIELLISGDIDEVNNFPSWIKERSEAVGMEVYTPLWQIDRMELINRIPNEDFRVIFSLVRKPWFTSSWVGDRINPSKIDQLSMFRELKGIDICGEQGEYHTLVLDGPIFNKTMVIQESHIEAKSDFYYLQIDEITLRDK
ncbi:Dph6-related ATP pyrophosphatase [Solitalea canadensis]|uniref:PP-loop superfamily ATP-utilizing enzyme n=1 Tax=Solitalea canadensis (strain ATCC 29591 / DSM 3403 / JCM 21819 / LMG 8368 / NBRC 15130 / NCIMB 12057 / USAM 9D) TaxID=929556 RepID=H8KVE6_SOLCM|nr:diphthine--ammonia ligase [Solitalea canadensis]AFD06326.1 PP-loop superfamily ATP-utilizing enzyme [Solitalea canadensis DSM 3403]